MYLKLELILVTKTIMLNVCLDYVGQFPYVKDQ